MPAEEDDFIITDELTREALAILLGKWPNLAEEPLQGIIGGLIKQKLRDTSPWILSRQYEIELRDRTAEVFFHRVGDAMRRAIEELASASVAMVLAEETPPPKKRRRGQVVQHSYGYVMSISTYIIQCLELHGLGVTRSLVAVAYYQKVDCLNADEREVLLNRYAAMKQSRRDQYLRDYSKLLNARGLKFEELEEDGRRIARTLPGYRGVRGA